MKLVFWFEDLHIERTVWGEVLYSPGPENGLMVLSQKAGEIERGGGWGGGVDDGDRQR